MKDLLKCQIGPLSLIIVKTQNISSFIIDCVYV